MGIIEIPEKRFFDISIDDKILDFKKKTGLNYKKITSFY